MVDYKKKREKGIREGAGDTIQQQNIKMLPQRKKHIYRERKKWRGSEASGEGIRERESEKVLGFCCVFLPDRCHSGHTKVESS